MIALEEKKVPISIAIKSFRAGWTKRANKHMDARSGKGSAVLQCIHFVSTVIAFGYAWCRKATPRVKIGVCYRSRRRSNGMDFFLFLHRFSQDGFTY